MVRAILAGAIIYAGSACAQTATPPSAPPAPTENASIGQARLDWAVCDTALDELFVSTGALTGKAREGIGLKEYIDRVVRSREASKALIGSYSYLADECFTNIQLKLGIATAYHNEAAKAWLACGKALEDCRETRGGELTVGEYMTAADALYIEAKAALADWLNTLSASE